MTAPYEAGEGWIEARVPRRGPCFEEASPCRVVKHHRRRRKTGPAWGFVAVARCRAHAVAFTVYPPGHVPYGRVPWVDVAPDGGAIEREDGSAPTTFFTAAEDAAQGERWPRDTAPSPPDAVRSTQRRRVLRAATLLGLVQGRPPTAQTAAGATQLPAGRLVEGAGRLAACCDLALWGREVTDVLAELVGRAGRALMDRLAVLGHLAGHWGRPWRWWPRGGRWLALGRPYGGVPGGEEAFRPSSAGPPGPTHDFGPRDPP